MLHSLYPTDPGLQVPPRWSCSCYIPSTPQILASKWRPGGPVHVTFPLPHRPWPPSGAPVVLFMLHSLYPTDPGLQVAPRWSCSCYIPSTPQTLASKCRPGGLVHVTFPLPHRPWPPSGAQVVLFMLHSLYPLASKWRPGDLVHVIFPLPHRPKWRPGGLVHVTFPLPHRPWPPSGAPVVLFMLHSLYPADPGLQVEPRWSCSCYIPSTTQTLASKWRPGGLVHVTFPLPRRPWPPSGAQVILFMLHSLYPQDPGPQVAPRWSCSCYIPFTPLLWPPSTAQVVLFMLHSLYHTDPGLQVAPRWSCSCYIPSTTQTLASKWRPGGLLHVIFPLPRRL